MGGVSAAISKTAAAPIERVKLLLQNQGELVKSGRLETPYKVFVLSSKSIVNRSINSACRALLTASQEYTKKKALPLFGEETLPTYFAISPLKHSTLHFVTSLSVCSIRLVTVNVRIAKIIQLNHTSYCFRAKRRTDMPCGRLEILLLAQLLVDSH
jgi:hypothetical protein